MSKKILQDVDRFRRAAMAAQHRDGLIGLFGGALLLGIGLIWLVSPGIVAVFAALYVVFALPMLERAKQRFTYPRIGYSAPPVDDGASQAKGAFAYLGAMLVVTLVVMALTGGVDSAAQWRRWAPLLFGLMSSGGFFYAAGVSGLRRYHVIGVGSIVLGFTIGWFSDGSDYAGVGIHLLTLGAVLLGFGVIEAIAFVRAHPLGNDA